MKANIQKLNYSDKIASHRKENGFTRSVSILDRDTGRELVISRTYWTGETCRACVWIHGDDLHGSGAGMARGGGYHKESAAIGSALSNAGVALSEDIGGRGDTAIDDALNAVAATVSGKRKFFLVRAHA